MTKPKSKQRRRALNVLVDRKYDVLDTVATKWLETHPEYPVSCRKGCHHCCNLAAMAFATEGYSIAVHLLRSMDDEALLELVPRLRRAALEYCYNGINEANYGNQAIPCVLLKDGLCSIYEKRPTACRYHYVTSPVEDCASSAEKMITTINFRELKDDFANFDVKIREQGFGFPDGWLAPIPISILWGMKELTRQPAVANTDVGRSIIKVCKEIPSPREYMETYGSTFDQVRSTLEDE